MIDVIDHAGVRELRLDRPPANAIDLGLLEALGQAVEEAVAAGCEAVVLSGRPGMFSAGLDVPFLMGLSAVEREAFFVRFFATLEDLVGCGLPVVAAITGHAPAGGLVLALCCDRRVMAEGGFKVGLNEVQVGIPIPEAVVALASWAVGPRQAEKMCVSGELFDPAAALDLGLVDEVVDPQEVVGRAVAAAAAIARAPALALRLTREAARRALVEAVARVRTSDSRRLLEAWEDPTTQAALAGLLARIGSKS